MIRNHPTARGRRRRARSRGGRSSPCLPAIVATLVLAEPSRAFPADEWRDLHDRCRSAVTSDAPLDTAGLEQRGPSFLAVEVPNGPLGTRIDLQPAPISGRTLPTGIWAHPGGRFELQLIEYPTRAGSRAICEIRVGRGAPRLTDGEAASIFDQFEGLDGAPVKGDGARLVSAADANARGCPIVASVSHDGRFFRSAVSERAGVPSCGGASLLKGLRDLQEREGAR